MALVDIQTKINRLRAEINRVIISQNELVDECIAALLCAGHVLLEGAPGLGKTLLVKTLGQAIDVTMSRIQFTPDLMPADVIGTNVLVSGDEPGALSDIRFSPGPIFAHLVLADEINRATPKTQSALLEAMQERNVTAFGTTYPLEPPFFVMATQNPIEMEGTYPLPEAQIDRFLFKLLVTPPNEENLLRIALQTTGANNTPVDTVMTRDDLLRAQRMVREMPIASHVAQYAVRIVHSTHPQAANAPEEVRRFVLYGASPRGAQAIILAAKARAFMAGRFNAAVDDVIHMAKPALRHRLILGFQADTESVTTDDLIDRILASVPYREAG